MNWNEVTAICAVVTVLGTLHAFIVLSLVRDEIRKLNGTYLRRELANQKFAEIEKHFDFLRDNR